MLLAVDARNRAISIGFAERDLPKGPASGPPLGPPSGRPSGRWLARRTIGVLPGRSSDEYALLLQSFAREAGGARRVEACWMSSVVPALTVELGRAVATAFSLAPSVVGPGVRTGVKIRTDVPSEVGSDLVCAAAAARELVGAPCVVVEFDAAIAFAAIGREGDFLGAAIAPGMGTAAEALSSGAALIPAFAGVWPDELSPPAIGRTTAQSLRSGLFLGYAGLVERIVRAQREALTVLGEADSPESVRVVGSGDEAGRALLASIGLGTFVPDLVLEGLAIFASRAAPSRPLAC